MSESAKILEQQIRECFGRVVYTHKTHEKMADICSERLTRLKVAQIVINAITACGALTIVFVDQFLVKLVTAIISFASLCLSAYLKGFDPGGTAQKHRDAAATLWDVRESYLSLLTDLRRGAINDSDASIRRDSLQGLLANVYKGTPQTSSKAYARAQQALKELEDYTFCDAELNALLPGLLRKS